MKTWKNIEIRVEVMVPGDEALSDEQLLQLIQSKQIWVGVNGSRVVSVRTEAEYNG